MTDESGSGEATLGDAQLIDRSGQADIYEWGAGRVLRLMFDGSSVTDLTREAEAMQAASAAGVPVPAAHEVLTVDGRAGMVMDRVDGGPMLSAMLARPWRIFPLARRFGEIHGQIHQIEAQRGEGEVHEAVASRLNQLESGDAWLRDWARRELEQLPRGGVLLHGDYHPLNLLMADSNPVVIDWPGASAGLPEADIAQTLVLIEASDPPNGSPLMLKLLRVLRTRLFIPVYLRGYRRVGEFDRELVNRWRMVRTVERLAVAPANEERALRRMIRESGGPRDFGPT